MAISTALLAAQDYILNNNISSTRQVIDVSGDGANNAGRLVDHQQAGILVQKDAATAWAEVNPDLAGKATRIDITRYGHAMAVPVPGMRRAMPHAVVASASGRLRFAHGDWSGYSVFEEAFTRGHHAASGSGMARSGA